MCCNPPHGCCLIIVKPPPVTRCPDARPSRDPCVWKRLFPAFQISLRTLPAFSYIPVYPACWLACEVLRFPTLPRFPLAGGVRSDAIVCGGVALRVPPDEWMQHLSGCDTWTRCLSSLVWSTHHDPGAFRDLYQPFPNNTMVCRCARISCASMCRM